MWWQKFLGKPSLKRWVMASAILPVVLLSMLSLWGIPRALESAYQRQQQALVEPLIDQTLRALQGAWIAQDQLSMNQTLRQLVERPAISGVSLSHLRWHQPIEHGVMANGNQYSAQLIVGDEVAGRLLINLSTEVLAESKAQVLGILSSAAVLVCVMGLLIGSWWRRRMDQLLAKAVHQWRALPADYHPIEKSFAEFEVLDQAAEHIHQCYLGEQAAKQALSRFVASAQSEHAVKDAVRSQAQLRSVALLHVDFSNWREVSQSLKPKQLAKLLDHYYFFVRQAAMLYNGEVDPYQGQGLRVTFGLRQKDEEDCFHALCAGELFLELVYRFNVHHALAHQAVCRFALALHSGTVLSTSLEGQQSDRWSLVGDVIHHTALMCQHKEQRLLISDAVLKKRPQLASRVQLEESQHIRCDAQDEPIPTYWLEGLNAPYAELVQRQAERILSMRALTTT